MPIYKQDSSGKFVPFEETPFPDLEQVLEDWIEANPHILLDDEDIVIFARQPRTTFSKFPDLIGVDKAGATVIVELKRGETPRDVVAQTLEYAAWIDSQSLEQLDDLARSYAATDGRAAEGLADLYGRRFSSEVEEEEDKAAERVTFNNRQRLVIVAERISDEVEQTIRYLRTRYGLDIYGVEFSVHKAGTDTIINTTTVVGRERTSKSAQSWQPREPDTDEEILAKVKTDFLRQAVTGIERWVEGLQEPGLAVTHSSGSEHYLRYLGVSWLYYYYAENWIYMALYGASDDEAALLRERLSKRDSLITKEEWGYWRFHVATDADLETVKEIVLRRLETRKQNST